MDLPMCCGKSMKVRLETFKFLGVACDRCGDIVYLKKQANAKPQMIDD